MKSIPCLFLPISIAIKMMIVASTHAESGNHSIELEKAFYEEKIAGIEKQYAASIAKLTDQYTKALKSRADDLQQEGDLDGLLAIREEIARFEESGEVPAEAGDGTHEIIAGLRNIFRNAKDNADGIRVESILDHVNSYLSHLEGLQKKMTRDGNLDEAVIVRDEANRVRTYKTKIEAQKGEEPVEGEVTSSTEAGAANDRLVIFWDGKKSSAMMGANGLPSLKFEFDHEGGNKLSNGVLDLNGGRTLVEGVNKQLFESCVQSNELSVLLNFETDSIKQEDHARIISYSLDGHHRNFTICQVKDELVLRLRTTKTGNNGTNPEVALGKIKKGRIHQLVLSYSQGQLFCCIDGESKALQQIDGDFSNWEKYQLVLGNEWKDERPWNGSIHQFGIYSSAIAPERAIQLTK